MTTTRPQVFFLCIPASVADGAAIDPKGIKTLFYIFYHGNPVFSNAPSNLPRNPPGCIILDNSVFDNLISANKWFAKALRRFATCLLVNHNLWGKLFSLLPIIFDDSLKTSSVSFFIDDFNLLSCELDSFTLNYCIVSFLYW